MQPYLAFLAGWSDLLTVRTFAYTANKMGAFGKLGSKLALLERSDAGVLAGIILFYCLGYAIFHHSDTKTTGLSYGLISTIVALYTLADAAHHQFPSTRAPVVLVSLASGIINAVSAKKTQLTTHMLTIHLHHITGDTVDYFKGKNLPPHRVRHTLHRVQVCLCLAAGAAVGTAMLFKVDSIFSSTNGHSFALVGALYGLVLVAFEQGVFVSPHERSRSV